jgi:UDP-N-acetylglucosamine 2-epimerase (non-hydrolysing)
MTGEGFAERIGGLLGAFARTLAAERPDRVLVLGDTDSGMVAFVAARLGVPVAHLEAGNRCFDPRVPEEVNRRLIDHCSHLLLPYTDRSRSHLVAEGIPAARILVVGNPIGEVMAACRPMIEASPVLERLGLDAGRFVVATAHRQENVDHEPRLKAIVQAMEAVAADTGLPVLVSVHPRTRARLREAGISPSGPVRWCEPFGFPDFVRLTREAALVLTDSGTVQEEACLLGVPTVTLRDTTERPETVECGSNVLAGVEPDAVRVATRLALSRGRRWTPPAEYLRPHVADTVASAVVAPWPP